MARKKKQPVTSITADHARDHHSDAALESTLFCEIIPGFHLIKRKKASAWRWRYRNAEGKTTVFKLGTFPGMSPDDAAAYVKELEGTDPVLQGAQRRRDNKAQAVAAEARVLKVYLQGTYKPIWETWPHKSQKALEARFREKAMGGAKAGNLARFSDMDMASIRKADIDSWQQDMWKAGLSPDTIRRDFTALRALLNEAVKDDLLTENPIKGHELRPAPQAVQNAETKRYAEQKAKRRQLTAAEVRGILTGLDSLEPGCWFRPFCMLTLSTGWAPSDLLQLTWSQVELEFGPRLTKPRAKTSHKRLRAGSLLKDMVMPLTADTTAMLKAWKKSQPEGTRLVFPSPQTGRVMEGTPYKRQWKRVKKAGGLPDELVFYGLRHHVISTMVAAGIPTFTVGEMVGTSEQMIADHYGHLCPQSAAQAVDVVARSIAAGEVERSIINIG